MSQRIKHDPAVRPFLANVPEAALVDLRRRVAATRWPEGDILEMYRSTHLIT